jgi:flagellar FliJ protein
MSIFRLQPLVEFAEERSKLAAQELQRQRNQWTLAEEKLQQLEAYLADYRLRLTDSAADGMTMSIMRDFQRFIAKLELAIRAQAEEIARCQRRWETAQQLWNEREREVKAYHTLRERHELEEHRTENKQDQRLQDEFAQNIVRSRMPEDITPHK